MARQRLSKNQRQQEILEAARLCFLEKGFQNTTMEAVVGRTTLSKGGVYRYYSSTIDMLSDLMKAGTALRFNLMKEHCILNNKDNPAGFIECLVESTYQKMIDENPYKKLYAIFLLESQNNEKLFDLKEELTQDFFMLLPEEGFSTPELISSLKDDAFIEFINAIIVGVEMMGMREAFQKNPDFLKTIIRNHFENTLKK